MKIAPQWRILTTDIEIVNRVFEDACLKFRAVLKDHKWTLEIQGFDPRDGHRPPRPWMPTQFTCDDVEGEVQDLDSAYWARTRLAIQYLSSFDWKQSYGEAVVFETPSEVEVFIEQIKDDPAYEDEVEVQREILEALNRWVSPAIV